MFRSDIAVVTIFCEDITAGALFQLARCTLLLAVVMIAVLVHKCSFHWKKVLFSEVHFHGVQYSKVECTLQ